MKRIFTALYFLLLLPVSFAQKVRFVADYDLRNAQDAGARQTPLNKKAEYKFASATQKIPVSISFRQDCPVVGMQDTIRSCGVWAAVYGGFSILKKIYSNVNEPYSPIFVFNAIQKYINPDVYATGTTLSTIVQCMEQYGTCPYSEYDSKYYFDKTFIRNVEREAKKNADQLTFTRLFDNAIKQDSIKSNDEKVLRVKLSLANNMPVFIGLKCKDNFDKLDANNCIYRLPQNYSYSLGHAVLCVSYDDNTQMFTMLNSYGTTWGEGGYFYVRYADFSNVVYSAFALSLKNSVNEAAFFDNPCIEVSVMQYDTVRQSFSNRLNPLLSRGEYSINNSSTYLFHFAVKPGSLPYRLYIISVNEKNEKKILLPYINDRSNNEFAKLERNRLSANNIEPMKTIYVPDETMHDNSLVKKKGQPESVIMIITKQAISLQCLNRLNYCTNCNNVEEVRQIIEQANPGLTVPNIPYASSFIGFYGALRDNQAIPFIINFK